ncbi:MAG: hypothetical protein Tsb0020_44400 [Haliangiales bacterium]
MSKRPPDSRSDSSVPPGLAPARGGRIEPRRVGLQLKLVAVLLAIASVPLLVAALLIEQTGQIAHNFATNETAFLRPHLDRARQVYVELISAKRDLYYRQVALRVAELPELAVMASGHGSSQAARAGAQARLARLVATTRELRAVEVIDAAGGVLIRSGEGPPGSAGEPRDDADDAAAGSASPPEAGDIRLLTIEQPIASGETDALGFGQADDGGAAARGDGGGDSGDDGADARGDGGGGDGGEGGADARGGSDAGWSAPARVRLTFAASAALQEDYVALQLALRRAERIDEVRTALPSSYRSAFWLLFGVVVVLISLTGILLARRFTARIEALVQGTRRVSAGDLATRVELPGRDELAELSLAFDRMVGQLDNDREQIAYLQRVGAWQDVARKLAHEIKNPLTPIQLAVQQLVSTYSGDEPRYQRTLRATEEIVTEEIASLRRLVDAFRTLGQLPPVEAAPLDLGEVVADLMNDPVVCDQLSLQAPDQAVIVRGDRMLLRRVLTNLVENGIHAGKGAGNDGRVVLRWHAEPREERAVLWVDDEGPGVSAERRDKIFEPYVTGKEEGTGLGLTICKKIVLEHRGRLRVAASTSSLGGARFVLTLPLADDEPLAPRSKRE